MKLSAFVQTLLLGAALALPASALALEGVTRCPVDEVATFQNRVHVRCGARYWDKSPWPSYFAVPTSSSNEAARLVTMGTAAYMGDWQLQIFYDVDDMNAASYGCANQDCRRPTKILLYKEYQFE